MPYKNQQDRTANIKLWRKRNPERAAAISKKYYETHRKKAYEYNRNHALKSLYGITTIEYNEMFAAQDGKCAICGKHQVELKKRLHVDHNHLTGKVRGLLCSNCNTMIGLSVENSKSLRLAAEYLEEMDK